MTQDIVDRGAWEAALAEQAERENAAWSAYVEATGGRRSLPMTAVKPGYLFTNADGEHTFAEIFEGTRYLIVYHFMFQNEWERGCPGCSAVIDALGSHLNEHLALGDARFVFTSRAPAEKLEAYKAHQGWDLPWYSVGDSGFNEEMGIVTEKGEDYPAWSVFCRTDDGTICRTYFTDGDVMEAAMPIPAFARMLPIEIPDFGAPFGELVKR